MKMSMSIIAMTTMATVVIVEMEEMVVTMVMVITMVMTAIMMGIETKIAMD